MNTHRRLMTGGVHWLLALALLAVPGVGWGAEITCVQCHGAQPGPLGEPVKLWQGSIHKQNGIACNDCHGGDPTLMSMDAMDPARGFLGAPAPEKIPDFCGRCHVGVKEDYLQSPHGKALGKGGPQCVTCHGNHAVQQASIDLINEKDCSRCHAFGRAQELKEAMVQTDSMITSLRNDLKGLNRLGIVTKEMDGQVFSARNDFHRLFHNFNVEIVKEKTAAVQDQLGKVRKAIDTLQQQLAQRKMAGAAVVGLLVLAGILLVLIARTYRGEGGGH